MSALSKSVLRSVSEQVASQIDGVFLSLIELRDAAAPLLNAPDVHHEALADLKPIAHSIIDRHNGLVSGAGLAVAPGALADATAWMQSWHRIGSVLTLTRHSLNPTAVNYYDYTDMEWFREPVEYRVPYLAGPYMDFGGTNRRIITAAVPVNSWNNTISVIVADLSLSSLERILLSALGMYREGVALVTAGGKVIATNSAFAAISGRVDTSAAPLIAELPATEVALDWRLVALNQS